MRPSCYHVPVTQRYDRDTESQYRRHNFMTGADFSVAEVAKRLDRVLGKDDNRTVAEKLQRETPWRGSYEKVRNARQGNHLTIAHDLIAAVAVAYQVDAGWLLLGPEESPPRMKEPRAAYEAGGAEAATEAIEETERLAILRLLSFVSQVVASGPVSSIELMEDLRALASVLHVQQLAGDTPGGETSRPRDGGPGGLRPGDGG